MNYARLILVPMLGALSNTASNGQSLMSIPPSAAIIQLRQVSAGAGVIKWAATPHLVLDATDSVCETQDASSCKLHLEVHGKDAAYTLTSRGQSIRLKQTSSGVTRSNGRDTQKTLSGQAANSLPDYFPLTRLLKTLEDTSVRLSVSANDGKTITVTAETADERKRKSDPLDFLNTHRFLIDAQTGELRAIEFTVASLANSRMNRPAKVTYSNYTKATSGVLYPQEIHFEIDGRLVNDYHVTHVDTEAKSFSENTGAGQ